MMGCMAGVRRSPKTSASEILPPPRTRIDPSLAKRCPSHTGLMSRVLRITDIGIVYFIVRARDDEETAARSKIHSVSLPQALSSVFSTKSDCARSGEK